MTNKAYIVANEQQESEVLEKLEREGYLWRGTDMRPTEKHRLIDEPITIFARDDKRLTFDYGVNEAYLADYEIEIDFDGRKEEQMSDKYVVSQEFMNSLEWWKNRLNVNGEFYFISNKQIQRLPENVQRWRNFRINTLIKSNERSLAIIRWVNGEDVFEVEKPRKWVVRSIGLTDDDERYYVSIGKFMGLKRAISTYIISQTTRFDTKEEAQSWANGHQEVIEVEV